jgi:hypothetical protein
MKSIRVAPGARIVRAEPGVLGAELDRETQAFVLATSVGTVSTTGIAGLTTATPYLWRHRWAQPSIRETEHKDTVVAVMIAAVTCRARRS